MNRPYALKLHHMDQKVESRARRVEEARLQAEFSVVMSDADVCPDFHKHTNCPREYFVWREWAEQMMKTHKQTECKVCKVCVIWVPKKPRKK